MADTDDYLALVTPEPSNFGYRQGRVVTWDAATGANVVRVGDTELRDLPLITNSDLNSIRSGDTVAIIKYNDSFAVLGKIKRGSAGTPWIPVVFYPQFEPLTAAGAGGYATVNAGTLVSWEGRIYATHHSMIQIDGIWGQSSGTNTVTYQLQVGGVTVGTWTTVSTFDVSRKGPFDISPYTGQQFMKVELKISASSGTGTVAFQPLGAFLR